ncbi:MAG: anthranilate phosphoribosyltransferase [Candidatus Omnitrophica bacterium]|nr:anthranilate phosphoribosyltransferase [Candidatus Omnitrophota bacterium]MDD5429536.1 anthranilate phosphoribosyltransferase [Candidatus Omnitrophota bacterium]
MIQETITKLLDKKNLSAQEAEEVFKEIFDSKTTPAQISAFLVALRAKGESQEEIYAAAKIIREYSIKINIHGSFLGVEIDESHTIDTCGTGGSAVNKFNISTAVAFVVASSGARVAKHGNRAMSSSCGSADVLEELGIKIDVTPQVMENSLKQVGIGFLYAPLYHPVLSRVAEIRKEIKVRTIFNLLGPLCNPARTPYQLLGVYSEELAPLMAKALRKLGLKRAFVVYSKDLKDEISLGAENKVYFLDKNRIKKFSLRASSFGLKRVPLEKIEVSNKKESARVIKEILEGKKGPHRDIVLANAAACFYILGKVNTLKEGVKLASQLIDTGKAKDKFLNFKDFLEAQSGAGKSK